MTESTKHLAAELARCAHKVLLIQGENDRLKTENEQLRENLRNLAEKHYDAPAVGIHLPEDAA